MIAPCTTSDIPALAALLRGLQAHHAAHLPQRFHDRATEADLRDVLHHALSEGAELLAYRVEGVPRGYLMWRWGDRRDGMPGLAQLDHLWTDPSWRRRGIARRLLAAFEARTIAQGAQGWSVAPQGTNAAARALMAGAGARPAARMLEKRFAPV
ncbi:GNAT family N-acetyltransferase [Salipiger marinus]|uniref:GNAT family N-acetyltransferase n=1 Tax=Salipiger marinus TaxID=555512 RepID=UPI001E5457E8|nr:GNAT family N-acetyltransferase [Salipiger manganoxidans]MCD1619995.1 GNAT family N-acetyltransferase [Salipiger manganoxidans]MEB3420941.1 GNAT family N-acetyltransferase [Salipiger manganoxidans]